MTGLATHEPVATNVVRVLLREFVPVFQTNKLAVPVTTLVAKPAAALEATPQGRVAEAQFVKWLRD